MGANLTLTEFLLLYPLRAKTLMWLLGAGSSAAGQIPTAGAMILDFKRRIYAANNGLSIRTFEDMANPRIRERIEAYFTGDSRYPTPGSAEEYAYFFEAAYPHEADRRAYIEQIMKDGRPSYGHVALGALMKADLVRLLWTTNFDRMLEDAAAAMFGTSSKLVVASLGNPGLALQAMNETRWPVLGKLHGDFQERRLKNTDEELRAQDARLRQALAEACRRFGLVVTGYSGRDASVMEVLGNAIQSGSAFPQGLFWLHRPGSLPTPAADLIQHAMDAGIHAEAVAVTSFDELMLEVINQFEDLPKDLLAELDERAPLRVSDAQVFPVSTSLPLLRLNGLPVVSWPNVARRVECTIGGTAEVRDAIAAAGVDVLGARRRDAGVIAFGSDADIRNAFDPHGIDVFDVHAIGPDRLTFDTSELGLLVEALTRALARDQPLIASRRGHTRVLLVNPCQTDQRLQPLVKAVGSVDGMLPNGDGRWCEALEVQLAYALDRLWVVLQPFVWTEKEQKLLSEVSGKFVRGRVVTRYNNVWSRILDAWLDVLFGVATDRTFSAFGIDDGIDAVFRIGRRTGYSGLNK